MLGVDTSSICANKKIQILEHLASVNNNYNNYICWAIARKRFCHQTLPFHYSWSTTTIKQLPPHKTKTHTPQNHTTTERTSLCTGSLTYDSRLQVDKHSSGNVFPGARLAEEGVEGVVSSADGFVRGHLPVWLYAMLQTVELPAGIANLHASLSNVDGDTLTLKKREKQLVKCWKLSTAF